MTVTINKTDGTILTTIADGAADTTSTNIALIGRLYKNYGELINENMVKLLENFANSATPTTPIIGQLWFNTTTKTLNVYRSTGFVSLGRMTSSVAEPSGPVTSDLWWDLTDEQLKLYNGSSWIVIAPFYTASQLKTGAFPVVIADTTNDNHINVGIYQQNQIVAIFNKDALYTPNVSIPGFTVINQGLTLSTLAGNLVTDNLEVMTDAVVDNDLTVVNDATVQNDLYITGTTYANVLTTSGNVTLGDSGADNVTINAGTIAFPNDLIITNGDLATVQSVVVGENLSVTGDLTVNGVDTTLNTNVSIVGDTSMSGSTVADGTFTVTPVDANDFKVDILARVMINASTVETGYSSAGDVTMGAHNGIFGRNVPKFLVSFNGMNGTVYNNYRIPNVTQTSTGTYTLTFKDSSNTPIPLKSSYPIIIGSMNSAGFVVQNGTSTAGQTSVSIVTTNAAGTPTNFSQVNVVIFDGANQL